MACYEVFISLHYNVRKVQLKLPVSGRFVIKHPV